MFGDNEGAFVKRLFGNLVLAALASAVLAFFAAPAVGFFAIRSAAEASRPMGRASRSANHRPSQTAAKIRISAKPRYSSPNSNSTRPRSFSSW